MKENISELIAEIAELKLQLLANSRLFTLTAEEVEMVYNTLNGLKELASSFYPAWRISNEDSKETKIADNLLTRINQWQDGNKKG